MDRWADERAEQSSSLAAELVSSGVDLLVTIGTPATLAARNATVTIPIVFVGVGDPVSVGAVHSLARPGDNATGLSLSSVDVIAYRFQLLQELLPGLRRVAVILRDDPGLSRQCWISETSQTEWVSSSSNSSRRREALWGSLSDG